MIIRNFKGYKEGEDITRIEPNVLAYPSQNCIVHKGKVVTRLGIQYYGDAGDTDKGVHSSYVFKDPKSGHQIPIRVYDKTIQIDVKSWNDGEVKWVDLYTLPEKPEHMDFTTWVDSNTAIIKKRLFVVFHSNDMLQWNGAVAIVKSVNGNDIVIEGDKTLEQLGFDKGDTVQQTIIINGTEYTYSTDTLNTTTLTLDSAPSGVQAGDILYVKPLLHSNEIEKIKADYLYRYKNHVVVASYDSNELFFSHVSTYDMSSGLDWTVPASGSRTAASPMYFTLDGSITAIHERKGVLWVSTLDDWFKITKLYEENGAGEWATVEKVESTHRMGAMPHAVAGYKSDMIFIAQDKTIQTVSDLEVLQSDYMQLISDDIEGLLQRVDLTDARIYHHGRYIYVTVPKENMLLMLDVVEKHWQPPQIMPVSTFHIIDGEKIIHSSTNNESYYLFKGRTDLDAGIQAIIATGYIGNMQDNKEYEYLKFGKFGLSGYMTEDTQAKISMNVEYDGSQDISDMEIDGGKIKFYEASNDNSLGRHPFGSVSWAGGDEEINEVKRFFAFTNTANPSFFEWRPIITVSGDEPEFHLLGISLNIRLSERSIEKELFVE